jgi:hypothetical protein
VLPYLIPQVQQAAAAVGQDVLVQHLKLVDQAVVVLVETQQAQQAIHLQLLQYKVMQVAMIILQTMKPTVAAVAVVQ